MHAKALSCLWAPGPLVLAACTTPPPPEFAVYQSAFGEADEATKEFVQVWAPLERRARAPADQDTKFDPNLAAYYTEDGTARLDRADRAGICGDRALQQRRARSLCRSVKSVTASAPGADRPLPRTARHCRF